MNRRERRRQLLDAIRAVDLARVRDLATADPTIAASRNSHGNVPLGDAIDTGNLELVQLLVELGADPHNRNDGGRSLLEGAAFGGQNEIARYLISLGEVPSVHHLAALGDVPALRGALTEDPTLLQPTAAGGRWCMTPLHAAVIAGRLEVVEYLLTTDALVDEPNHNGHTALALLVDHSSAPRLEIAAQLLAHGADVDADAGHHGGTLLHRVVMNGDVEFAKLLVDHGADADRQDWSGKTPLHYAVAKNRQLVELLLTRSPDLSLESNKGENALQLATRLKKTAIVRLLGG